MSLWIARSDVVGSPMGDKFALLDQRSNVYYTLNATAAVIWRHLGTPSDIDTLCRAVAAEFDITEEACADDVRQLVLELNEMSLITSVDRGVAE